VKPGSERARAVEAVKGTDRGEERLLGNVLSRATVADHEIGGTVGTAPVPAKELLECLRRALLRVAHQHPLRARTPRSREQDPRLRGLGAHWNEQFSRDRGGHRISSAASWKTAWP
jgi:hypothetical protein